MVDLKGFENTLLVDRKIVTEKEYQKILDSIHNYKENFMYYFLMEYIRNPKTDVTTFLEMFGMGSTDELFEFLKEENGIDVETYDSNKIIKELLNIIEIDINKLDEIIESNTNFSELAENPYIAMILNELDKKYIEQLKDTADYLSRRNLSQISSDKIATSPFLKYMNLQNTGAQIDFEKMKRGLGDEGFFVTSPNLKGTKILSFDPQYYLQEGEIGSRGYQSYKRVELRTENFDEENYQVIINYYKNKEYIPKSLIDFLSNENLFNENRWVIDFAFEHSRDNDIPSYIYSLWEKIPENLKRDYESQYSKLLQELAIGKKIDEISKMLLNTPSDMIEKNMEYIKKGFFYSDGKTLQKLFYDSVLPNLSSQYLESLYRESNEEPIYYRAMILSKNSDKFIDENFPEIFNSYKNSMDNTFVGDVMSLFTKHKYSKDNIERIIEGINNSSSNFGRFADKIFGYLNREQQVEYYKEFIKNGVEIGATPSELYRIFENFDLQDQEDNFYEFLNYARKISDNFGDYVEGQGFINLVLSVPEEKREKYYIDKSAEILKAFRIKYKDEATPFIDDKSADERALFDKNYDPEGLKALLDLECKKELNPENVNVIIENLPKLGVDVIQRIMKSNSEMIRQNSSKIISAVAKLPRNEAISIIEDTERVFCKSNIPDFFKLYKFFDNVIDKKQGLLEKAVHIKENFSPELQQAGNVRNAKRIIFADLLNISLRSNNKSMYKFLDILEQGNRAYVKYLSNGKEISSLSEEEKRTLKEYTDTLYTIYSETDVSRIDMKKTGKKIQFREKYTDTLDELSKRYIGDINPSKLSNSILSAVLGRNYELLSGKRTIKDFRDYMKEVTKASNERHKELEKTKLVLEPGDMIKGIKDATEFLQSLFENGVRAGEFLGISTHTDSTPLDSDHSLILPKNIKDTLSNSIDSTPSRGYGNFFIVIKSNSNKIEYSRSGLDENSVLKKREDVKSSLGTNADKEQRKIRRDKKTNGTLDEAKYEAFSSGNVGENHFGIRTGMAITDVDYIVVAEYDKRIGYELAMNGTFIPVVDKETNEVIFGIDDYNKIREQMQGLSYYDAGPFKVNELAFNDIVSEKIDELFPEGDINNSISEIDARKKREAIEEKVQRVMFEKMGLGFESKITGDLSPGFIEFIDTGSTGRGTNVPGDGDFDFSVKIDKSIMESPEKLSELKDALREVLKVPSSDPEAETTEVNGNFRYKKMNIEGTETPLDIDITFMPKTDTITYSTDMAIRERLDNLKRTDPEGYKATIANIVIAKEMLKKEGIYKKQASDKATKEGGFGGVGVENWILQNGGSFVQAMKSFLEIAEKSKNFQEFQENYPIMDFGQNHMLKGYAHDSFIKGLTESGYDKMQRVFKDFIKELDVHEKTGIGRKADLSIKDLVKNALSEEIRSEEFASAGLSLEKQHKELEAKIQQ